MKIFYLFLLLAKFALFDDSTENYEDYIKNLPGMQEMYKCLDAGKIKIDQCTSVTFDNDYQCCVLETFFELDGDPTFHNDDKISCIALNGSIDLLKKIYEEKKYKALQKELYGFLKYGLYIYEDNGEKYYIAPNLSHNQTYKCKDGSYKISFGYDTYTENEKKVLESDNHCLKYFYRHMYEENFEYDEEKDKYYLKQVSNNDCFNANLLQSSKDDGISCGYYEFKLNYVDGTTDTLTTCYFYNENFYKNGEFDEQTKIEFETLINQYSSENGKVSKSYITQFSDSEGNTYVFDSSTGKIESSNGSFYKLNFMILILFLIL